MKKFGLYFLAAGLTFGALVSSTAGMASTIDASNSISVSYDFSGISGPYSFLDYEVIGSTSTKTLTGPFSGTGFSLYQASFFNSTNQLIVSSLGASPVPLASFDDSEFTQASFSDPVGHVVFSSVGGATFDVSSILLGVSNNPNLIQTASMDVTSSITSVAATPLPPTWTMMLIGLAGFGFMAFRRKSEPELMAA